MGWNSYSSLKSVTDDRGNRVIYRGDREPETTIRFAGSDNVIEIDQDTNVVRIKAEFFGSHGRVRIGRSRQGLDPLRLNLRIGHDSAIFIGRDLSTTGMVFLSAVEGTTVRIGDDVMFARALELRTDDSHPIYSVSSGKQLNVSRDIIIGDHVWIAKHAVVMGGVTVRSGSVIGFRSIVTHSIPNNCVAVGSPARIVRRNIAWERTKTYKRKPGADFVKQDEKSAEYWRRTDEPDGSVRAQPRSLRGVRTAAADRLEQVLHAVSQRTPLHHSQLGSRLKGPAKALVTRLRPGK